MYDQAFCNPGKYLCIQYLFIYISNYLGITILLLFKFMNIIREKGNINQNVGRILFRSTVQDHYSLYTFKFPALFIGPIDRGVIHQQWHYYVCILHGTTSGRSFATFSFLFFRQSSQDIFFWSGLTKASQQLAQHDQSVSSPFLAVVVSEQKKNRTHIFTKQDI